MYGANIIRLKAKKLSGENALEDVLPLLAGSHMHAHIIGIFPKEQYMVSEYKSHLTVEFKDSVESTEKETAKRAEFLLVFKNHFIAVYPYVMVRGEHLDEMVYVKILGILRGLVVFLIDLLDYSICYHGVYFYRIRIVS